MRLRILTAQRARAHNILKVQFEAALDVAVLGGWIRNQLSKDMALVDMGTE